MASLLTARNGNISVWDHINFAILKLRPYDDLKVAIMVVIDHYTNMQSDAGLSLSDLKATFKRAWHGVVKIMIVIWKLTKRTKTVKD
jgi:hypothetical protein